MESDHERGYRAYLSGECQLQVEAHFSGETHLAMSDDWFDGYQDAQDDARMGNSPMYRAEA